MTPHARRRRALWGISALILAMLVHTSTAAGQSTVAAASVPTAGAAAQSVNDPSDARSACACALKGQPGACLTRPALLILRDAGKTELDGCRKETAVLTHQASALTGAVSAFKAQSALLGSALAEQTEATRRASAAAAVSQPSFWRRFGAGFALGILAGAAATIGITYALRPAR